MDVLTFPKSPCDIQDKLQHSASNKYYYILGSAAGRRLSAGWLHLQAAADDWHHILVHKC